MRVKKSLVEAIETIGGGDRTKGTYIIKRLAEDCNRARLTHPSFTANGEVPAWEVIKAEWKELGVEMRKNNRPRAKVEAFDVITTLVRLILDEDFENAKEE